MRKNFEEFVATLKILTKILYFYQPNFSSVSCVISICQNANSVPLMSLKNEIKSLVCAAEFFFKCHNEVISFSKQELNK